jgi:hypothetical protein
VWIAPHFWAYYDPRGLLVRREPFEWVEIDQPSCLNLYGDVNCGAVLEPGFEKCYNTIGTCQRIDNYSSGKLTLRFCRDTQRLPADGQYWFPYLVSATVKSATINPGGGNRSASALGTRATLSITLSDHPHSGNYVDPYVAERISGAAIFGGVGYDPLSRSSFWRKWAARNAYKVNRAVRYCCGYIDENGIITDVTRRHFVTTGFSGPNNRASVQFDAQDILASVQNEKAQAPAASTGKLNAAITAGSVSATLAPAGVGNLEYPTGGFVRIGSEVAAFVRVGDVLTLTRGQFNTTAEAADAGETVQLCLRFLSQTPGQIIRTLLVDYGRVPPDVIDAAQWATETSDWLPRLYSTLITEPVGVKELLSEISEQMYCYIWFDERAGLVRLRAVRPPADDPVVVFDEDNLVEDSVSLKEQADQQITRVVINYAPRDYTGSLSDLTNFRVTDVTGDYIEESEDRSNGARIKTIFSRWLEATDGAAAIELSNSLLLRYRTPPLRVSFSLDAKDRGIWVSDFVQLTTKQLVDQHGIVTPISAQIMEARADREGVSYEYVAQQYASEAPSLGKTIDIAADVQDINLRSLYDAKYGTPPGAETVTITVRPGVVVGSSSTATYAMQTGTWPPETTVLLVNAGYIVGRGGNGGSITFLGGGSPGGPAFYATSPIIVDTTTGIIGGGGGGGEGYQYTYRDGGVQDGQLGNAFGGGGAGNTVGAGGGAGASAGALLTGGAGRVVNINGDLAIGGAGGSLGQSGGYASAASPWNAESGASYGPGAGGAAIVGSSFVTLTPTPAPSAIRGAQLP